LVQKIGPVILFGSTRIGAGAIVDDNIAISLIDQTVSDACLQQSGQAPVFPLEMTPIPADGLFWAARQASV